jgi:prepilin-type N-terminal cleavage/methylation domain-containing protein
MDSFRQTSGFTLVEMLFATTIFALVVGGAFTFMAGSYRMTKNAFATTTLSVQQREVRERLLFRAVPTHGGVAWPGLLSAASGRRSAVEGGAKILMSAGGVNLATGAAVEPTGGNLQIVRHASSLGGYFVNDGDQTLREKWLRPMGAACVPESWVDEPTDCSSVLVTLGGALDGVGVTNRVVVPRFGVVQPTPSTGVFRGGL